MIITEAIDPPLLLLDAFNASKKPLSCLRNIDCTLTPMIMSLKNQMTNNKLRTNDSISLEQILAEFSSSSK